METESGFLKGPYFSEPAVTEALGVEDWSLSPRFLLKQGEDSKIRIIDDLKASSVNQALIRLFIVSRTPRYGLHSGPSKVCFEGPARWRSGARSLE